MVSRVYTFRSLEQDKNGTPMRYTVARSSIVTIYRNWYGDAFAVLSAPWDSTTHLRSDEEPRAIHTSYNNSVSIHPSDVTALLRWWGEEE